MAINVPIISQFDKKGIDKAMAEFKKLETPAQKAGFAIKKAFVPAAAALAGLTAAAVKFGKAAAEDQASAARLADQITRVTGATNAQLAAVEKYIGRLELQTNILDTDLRPALARLVTVTKDVESAQNLLNLAVDISAATGKDLGAVTEALSKAYGGNLTALQKLDPSLRDVVKSGASFDEIGQRLADTFGGAAAKATETAEGRFKNLGIQMGNAQEAIGYLILPIVQTLLPALQFLADLVSNNTTTFAIMGAVVGTVAAAVVAINIAMKAYIATKKAITAAVLIFNAVMAANPIMLVVAAVAALIAIFIVLQQRFDIVGKAARALGRVFEEVKDFILYVWNILLDWFRNLAGWLFDAFKTLFDILTTPYRLAFEFIFDVATKILQVFKDLPGHIRNLAHVIYGAIIAPFVDVVDAMYRFGQRMVEGIVSGIKSIGRKITDTVTSFMPSPTTGTILGSILPFADGGLVMGPTLGLIGEAGPEMVIPLDQLGRFGGGGSNITINVAGSVVQETDLVERIRIGLRQAQRNGRDL
jgi:hypothetical protein